MALPSLGSALALPQHDAEGAARERAGTGGLRAAVSRGLEVISHRGNEGIIREMVERPAVHYPDALARSPHPLVFTPVDDQLVLEDRTRRLEIYRVVEHSHMPDAVFAFRAGDPQYSYWESQLRHREAAILPASIPHLPMSYS